MIEVLIALLLLVPVAIIVLLILSLTRTSAMARRVDNLEQQTRRLENTVSMLNVMLKKGGAAQGRDAGSASAPAAMPVAENSPTEDVAPEPDEPQGPAARASGMAYSDPAKDDLTRQAVGRGREQEQAFETARKEQQRERARSAGSDATSSGMFQPIQAQSDSRAKKGMFDDMSLEQLIGGKLPIWIGGIALIFAAFFLVRYSIEAGLFGPRIRSITAAVFGLTLVSLSEFGKHVPRIGFAFAEDKRIGQSLAGAGIAILYGTLYMTSELYGLLPLWAAFVLVVAVSALAFALSLRHGPPTAIMGVIGGFAAPFVAGMDADSLPLLLSYLGVFMAALFALSLWQRWLWLMLMAVFGGGLWTLALVTTAIDGLPLLGLFIVGVAAAAIFAALRLEPEPEPEPQSEPAPVNKTGANNKARLANLSFDQWAIYGPQMIALVQLCILVPRMTFSPLGWAFLFAIGALSLLLAWRDKRLLLLTALTATGFLFPLAAGWYQGADLTIMMAITLGYAALFSGTAHGHIALRGPQAAGGAGWALLALLPVLVAYQMLVFQYDGALSDAGWGFVGLTLALPCALVAWRYRGDDRSVNLAAAGVTTIMLGTGLLLILPGAWLAVIAVIVTLGLMAWAHFIDDAQVRHLGYIPFGTAALAMLLSAEAPIAQMLQTLGGGYTEHGLLPAPLSLMITVVLPAILLIASLLVPHIGWSRQGKTASLLVGSGFLCVFLWLLAKQPFAIASYDDFVRFGFYERALITLAVTAAGCVCLWRGAGPARVTGLVLIGLAAARFVVFDLVNFNPVAREQAVGSWPVFNMAVLLCAALCVVFWWISSRSFGAAGSGNLPGPLRQINWRALFSGGALAMAVITVLVLVRQAVHGNIIAEFPVETTENYLYSAGLLLLALAWLGYAIWRGGRRLRQAGLGLLTLVTLKVFLVDAAAMEGVLRIVSFLGLGIALIVIGWAYRRLLARDAAEDNPVASPA